MDNKINIAKGREQKTFGQDTPQLKLKKLKQKRNKKMRMQKKDRRAQR